VSPEIEAHPITASALGDLPFAETHYRRYLPLMPALTASLRVPDCDLLITSSHCAIKALKPPRGARHLCYIHTPMRYAWDLADDYFETHDIHVHVPEGAIPKDGPSAGVTMATAMISAFGGTRVRRDVAMTGEITLRGDVLAIGGLKEKVLAARRVGIGTVILPKANRRDLAEIPKDLRRDMKFVFASKVDDVLGAAFTGPARTLPKKGAPAKAAKAAPKAVSKAAKTRRPL